MRQQLTGRVNRGFRQKHAALPPVGHAAFIRRAVERDALLLAERHAAERGDAGRA